MIKKEGKNDAKWRAILMWYEGYKNHNLPNEDDKEAHKWVLSQYGVKQK